MCLSLGLDDQSNDQTVQTESLRENENQNHTDEKLGLLSSGTDTSVTNNTNSNTSSKTTETSTQVSESSEASVTIGVDGRTDDDSNNESVNTNDTSHNNGNHRFHHQKGCITPMADTPTPLLAVP